MGWEDWKNGKMRDCKRGLIVYGRDFSFGDIFGERRHFRSDEVDVNRGVGVFDYRCNFRRRRGEGAS